MARSCGCWPPTAFIRSPILNTACRALEKRVTAGDSSALLERARLHTKSGHWQAASADLRDAYALIASQVNADVAASAVFSLFDEMQLATQRPSLVLDTVSELFRNAMLSPESMTRLDGLLAASLAAMPRNKTAPRRRVC